MRESICRYVWQDGAVVRNFRAAVSLHSHTQHSRERLTFVPRISHRIPILSQLVRQQERKFEKLKGKPLDFSQAWWTPPLPARQAYDLERLQIEQQLGLQAMVSLSDHDNIEACTRLQLMGGDARVPVSVEWTVPLGPSFIHIGVHNIPARWAAEIMDLLVSYTARPAMDQLPDVLSTIYGMPSTLIVFNHPLWDERGLGAETHRRMVRDFLIGHAEWIHALELNGLRSWGENRAVMALAREWELPLISGGDRHGCEPNALVNLTNALHFSEFVSEVRHDRHSEILFMEQYREPMKLRLMQGVVDAVRDYEDHPEGRRRWSDRVFFQCDDGEARSLSSFWDGDGPRVIGLFMSGARLLESRRVRTALRYALAERAEARHDISSQGGVLHRFLS